MPSADAEDYRTRLATALHVSAPVFTEELASDTVAGAPDGPTYAREEIEQMMRGFYGLLDESLRGGESELRDFYFTTVLPGLRDSGLTLGGLLPGTARLLVLIAADVTPRLAPEDRGLAGRWLGDFTQAYVRDIVALWSQGSA